MKVDASKDFGWLGQVTRVVEFFEYTIVEYFVRELNTKNITKEKNYGVYVNSEKTSQSFDTYDEAISFAIAYKYDGINTQAHRYFIKGIK